MLLLQGTAIAGGPFLQSANEVIIDVVKKKIGHRAPHTRIYLFDINRFPSPRHSPVCNSAPRTRAWRKENRKVATPAAM